VSLLELFFLTRVKGGEGGGDSTDLGGLEGGEVAVVDVDVVVVGHVVVFAEVVIIAIDDAARVHTGDIDTIAIDLDEAMEANVEQGEEVGHTNERLEVDPEHEAERTCDRCKGQGDGPVGVNAFLQEIVLSKMAVTFEEFQRGCAEHVVGHTVDVEHEMSEARAVQVPKVECVSSTAIQTMVDEDMRGCEVPGHIAVDGP
jgi:hypothetical protein